MKTLYALVSWWCFTSLAFAECQYQDRSVVTSIPTYQACLDEGQAMGFDVRSALSHIPDGSAKKEYKAAVREFSDQIKASTEDNSLIYFHRGLANLALGKERRALRDFETVNTQLGNYAPAHFYRGVALAKQRKHRDALFAFDTALAVTDVPTHQASIFYAKARSLNSTRSRELAITTLGDAINSDASFANAYFERARLRVKEGQERAAIEDYSQYIELRPDAAEAYYNRGLIYQDLRQDHLAIEDFSRAIELNPEYLKARASKGITYIWPLLPVLLVLMAG